MTAVWIGRIALAVIVIGGWQWFTTEGWVDKFFFGQPSEIWNSLVKLFTQGTAFGTIWENLWVTAKEAFGGFLLGTLAGVVIGILLGSNRYLSSVVGPYIRIVNSIPRIILGSIFIVAFGLGTFPKILLAAVLVFFIVFFNAFQGVREVDQNLIANVRVLGASPVQVATPRDHSLGHDVDHRQPAHGIRLRHRRRARGRGARRATGNRPDHQPGPGHLRPEHRLRLHGDHRGRHAGRRIPHQSPRAPASEVAATEPLRGSGHLMEAQIS